MSWAPMEGIQGDFTAAIRVRFSAGFYTFLEIKTADVCTKRTLEFQSASVA